MAAIITGDDKPCYDCAKKFSWIYCPVESEEEIDNYDVIATVVDRMGPYIKIQMICPHCKYPNHFETLE